MFAAAVTSAGRLYQCQRGELSIEPRRELGEAGSIALAGRCVLILEVAPALVRALGHGRNHLEPVRADDVDAAVAARFEAQDFHPRDDAVLDDVMELPANALVGAPGAHPRRDAQLAVDRPAFDTPLERFEARAAVRDL